MSYHVNRLQGCRGRPDYVVTLGGRADIDPDLVIEVMDYEHPAYTREWVAAQRQLPGLNTRGHRVRGRLPRVGIPRGRMPGRRGRGCGRGSAATC